MHFDRYYLKLKFLLFALLLIGLLFTVKITRSQTSNQQSVACDTVIVYDTVWEYETVYNSIVIYDTVFVDTTNANLDKISPLMAYRVYFSPFSYSTKDILLPYRAKKKTKINRSKFHKYLYKRKQKQSSPTEKKTKLFIGHKRDTQSTKREVRSAFV